MIRIDEVRELRRDLHMRPFEADRRVYLVFGAHLLNAEAADALLKDLEEPPPYAVVVLVADELGPLPETIRSRCQLVPFRRLSERAIRAEIDRRAPGLAPEQATAFARVAAGRLDRVERLLDPEAARRREELLSLARAVYTRPRLRPRRRRAGRARARGRARRRGEGRRRAGARGPRAARPRGRAVRQARRAWRRARGDPARARGARRLVPRPGRRRRRRRARGDPLRPPRRADRGRRGRAAARRRGAPPRRCARAWRAFEEFNVSPPLALEALFVRLRRALAGLRRPRNPFGGIFGRGASFSPKSTLTGKPQLADPAKGES